MSLVTWKAEFYPVIAQSCPIEDAVAHSIRKWEWLRKENLEKHVLCKTFGDIIDQEGSYLAIDSSSCALCRHYDASDYCEECPLAIAREGMPCYVAMKEEKGVSPYYAWSTGDPEPMIMWLKKI